ncbi:MAG: hypothetical protein LKG31_01725 [Lactobacillus sp.]|jgi:hypothetical protein|nr:hypothetical protein [Lactobacillus sp.]
MKKNKIKPNKKTVVVNRQMNFNLTAEQEYNKALPTPIGIDKKLYDLLPTGKQHPINASALAKALHINERTVKAIVNRLRSKYCLAIGSSRAEPSGYYIVSNLAEYADTLQFFNSSVTESLKVIDGLKRSYWGMQLTVNG